MLNNCTECGESILCGDEQVNCLLGKLEHPIAIEAAQNFTCCDYQFESVDIA